jgi:membrane associated rhomboid family serine protease
MFPVGDDNSSRRIIPWVTFGLIALNVFVFFREMNSGYEFIYRWAFVPARFLEDPLGNIATIFTAMFLHAGWAHIIGNMIYLAIFGDNVEDKLGHVRFLAFYLICGIVATLAQLLFSLNSTVPLVGASGAIAGALGAYFLLFPRRQVLVLFFFRVIPMPAFLVLGFWIVLQIFSGFGSITSAPDSGGVAYMAHIGGFAAGYIMAMMVRKSSIDMYDI